MPRRHDPKSPGLFNERIERVDTVTDQRGVSVPNGCEATYALDAKGRLWVKKLELNSGPNPLLAEALGYLLALELNVPTPPAAVSGKGDELAWLSLCISPVTHWAPRRAHFIKNLDGLGRAIALDALIFNDDRHVGNALLQFDPTDAELRFWSIDLGKARIGWPPDFASLGLAVPSTESLIRGVPVDLIADGAAEAAATAHTLKKSLLRRLVDEACDLAGMSDKSDVLLDALLLRLEHAEVLVGEYLRAIERMG